jgi:hypothetical protein
MQNVQINYSPHIFSILSQYPQWLSLIVSVLEQPLIDKYYSPEVIEVFDQYGLLAGRVHSCFSYECTRTHRQDSDFNAWMFDGQLAVFYVGSEIVINRLGE